MNEWIATFVNEWINPCIIFELITTRITVGWKARHNSTMKYLQWKDGRATAGDSFDDVVQRPYCSSDASWVVSFTRNKMKSQHFPLESRRKIGPFRLRVPFEYSEPTFVVHQWWIQIKNRTELDEEKNPRILNVKTGYYSQCLFSYTSQLFHLFLLCMHPYFRDP